MKILGIALTSRLQRCALFTRLHPNVVLPKVSISNIEKF